MVSSNLLRSQGMMNGQWTERDGNKQLIGGYTSSYSSQRYCSIVKNGPVRIVPYCSKFSTLIVPRYPIQTSIEDGPPTLGFFKLVATNLLIGLRMEPQRQPLAPVEVWASRGRHAGLGLDLRPYCTHTVLHLYTYYMLHLYTFNICRSIYLVPGASRCCIIITCWRVDVRRIWTSKQFGNRAKTCMNHSGSPCWRWCLSKIFTEAGSSDKRNSVWILPVSGSWCGSEKQRTLGGLQMTSRLCKCVNMQN